MNEVVKQHEAWRLASCMWLHEGVFHIIMNMVSLRFVGIRLEEEFGFGMSCTHFTSPKILDSKLSNIAYLAKLKSTFFEKYDMLNCFNHVAVWIGFCILCAFTQKKINFLTLFSQLDPHVRVVVKKDSCQRYKKNKNK